MAEDSQPNPISTKSDIFDGDFTQAVNAEDVGKEDRKHRVLAFLVDARLALPRTVLFRNLSYQGADFSDSSLKNYLGELREDGYVERIDAKEFADGNVVVSDTDPGYWLATSEGAEYIDDLRSDQRTDIDTGHL